jgi:DNA-directed RNA polymerase specialized sigma subunit
MARRSSGLKVHEQYDASFQRLAAELTAQLERNENGTDQKQQFEELTSAEFEFRKAVCKYPKLSTDVYIRFLQKITVENRNILSARPYFRETAKNFSKNVTPAIKARDAETLKTFDINFQLIEFIRDHWKGKFPAAAEVQYQRVFKARNLLCENNMPLAINRAKLFYKKTPKGPLSLMDMINIASTGLASGVDKYCGKYSRMLNGVIIGRIVGNLIDEYSATTLHFYPSDRRILYKANSLRAKLKIDDVEKLADAVNKSFREDALEGKSVPKIEVTAAQLSNLLNAATTVSSDQIVDEDGVGVYDFTPSSSPNAEDTLIERETTEQLFNAIDRLPLLHRKILQLKGVKL